MTTPLRDGWAAPKHVPSCPECGHFKYCHYLPKNGPATCGAAVQSRRGLVSCACKVRQDQIDERVRCDDDSAH